jgi:ubiquinol-cytochrome c reductase cytochrome b/c1 subunit
MKFAHRNMPLRTAAVLAAVSALSLSAISSSLAQGAAAPAAPPVEEYQIPRQNWTFSGLFGHFDEQQLRRGYKIYKNVCSNCHNMRLMSYRNLGEPGGPHFSKEEVEAFAADAQVQDGYNDQGEPVIRPGKPSDSFQWAFKNEAAARAALNGALPPDLSIMAKARGVEREFAWYAFPFMMLKDLFTQYQEQGADYIYALLTGYTDPPPGAKVTEGLYYDRAYPGAHQFAMPQPLQDGSVDYDDKTPNTLDQEARDVTSFLMWTAEPHLVARKKLGLWVLVYLAVVVALLFISKRTLWRNVEH